MTCIAARLTREMVADVLDYDPQTGIFTWRKSGKRRRVGAVAGTIANHGYRRIRVDGSQHLASHLAWIMVYGEAPNLEIDHIDRNRANDSIENLRLATTQQNAANTGPKRTNTSGYKGVSFHRQMGKWGARITDGDHYRHLGLFDDPADASAAYTKAAVALRGEFAPEGV